MVLRRIDRSKHPHPRRYKRAVSYLWAGIAAGALLFIAGAWAAYVDPIRYVWIAILLLMGPAVIFLSLVGFATYLERLEQSTYGSIYQDEQNPGTMGSAH